jgi:hypothetical protein
MQESELNAIVIESLAGGDDPDDIVYALCERTGWSWSQAEDFFYQIKTNHQDEVAKKQFPLFLFTAATTYATGIGLMAYSLYSVVERVVIERVMGFPVPDLIGGFRLILDFGFGPIVLFATGLAMVLGSLIGMRDAWKSMLVRD